MKGRKSWEVYWGKFTASWWAIPREYGPGKCFDTWREAYDYAYAQAHPASPEPCS